MLTVLNIAIVLLTIVILVFVQGFFSGSEIALVNCDKSKLRHRAKQGHVGSQLALRMLERPEVVLTTTLVGTNISLVTITVLGTTALVGYSGDRGDLLAVLLLVPLTLILGEIVPKSVYQQESNALAPRIIYPLYFFSIVLFPVIFVFSRAARLAARLIGRSNPGSDMFAVREQLQAVLETAEGAYPIQPFDRIRLRNVVRFGELSAADLMIPAGEMITIDVSQGMTEAVSMVRRGGHTHIPVYEGQRSNIVGMVSLTVWDLVDLDSTERGFADLIRPAFFVPAQQPVAELLPLLRNRDDQSAIVVDEFGTAVGLLTVDMILESIVGSVEVGTGYDERSGAERPRYEAVGEDAYLLDARLPVADVNDILATKISTATAHTIGGFIIARLRHVPLIGESIVENGYCFTVEEATDRAVVKIKVEPAP